MFFYIFFLFNHSFKFMNLHLTKLPSLDPEYNILPSLERQIQVIGPLCSLHLNGISSLWPV